MSDPRWMPVVIFQRRDRGRLDAGERLPYGDVDAEPLPGLPEREPTTLATRLNLRLRALMPTRRSAEGALR
jgi:hypothetical protein